MCPEYADILQTMRQKSLDYEKAYTRPQIQAYKKELAAKTDKK